MERSSSPIAARVGGSGAVPVTTAVSLVTTAVAPVSTTTVPVATAVVQGPPLVEEAGTSGCSRGDKGPASDHCH